MHNFIEGEEKMKVIIPEAFPKSIYPELSQPMLETKLAMLGYEVEASFNGSQQELIVESQERFSDEDVKFLAYVLAEHFGGEAKVKFYVTGEITSYRDEEYKRKY